MHKYFAEWYRVAGVEPKGDDLPKRWAGVESYIASLNAANAIDVARKFLGLSTASPTFNEQFAGIFQKADPAFRMRDNELELRVLAGTVAAQYLETQRTTVGDIVGLAVVSGACPRLREPVLLPDIVTIATNYLFHESLKVRAYVVSPAITGLAANAGPLLAEVMTVAAQNNLANTIDALEKPLQKLQGGVATAAKATNDALSRIDSSLQSLQEQTDVLWWVFAGNSRDFLRPFSGFSSEEACLIAGKELADLTQLLPGFVAAPAVLDKVLRDAGSTAAKVSFESAVIKADSAWKQKCLEIDAVRLDDLSPVHHAFRKSTEGTNWIRSFEAASGIKLKKALPTPVDLAMQVYLERLLKKAVRT
jgi:hypothetical protein